MSHLLSEGGRMQEGKGRGCETFYFSRPVREEQSGNPLFLLNMHQINWFKQSQRHRDLPRSKPKRIRNTPPGCFSHPCQEAREACPCCTLLYDRAIMSFSPSTQGVGDHPSITHSHSSLRAIPASTGDRWRTPGME